MIGFWTQTPDGLVVHVNGDPGMDEGTRFALGIMMDEVAKQFMACQHLASDRFYESYYGSHYKFVAQRCNACGEVTVKVMGQTDDGEQYLATLPTRIAPYATNKPAAGYAYYWRFDGLNHSTPPVAPAPNNNGFGK